MAAPHVAVIIVSYNTQALLRQCLIALAQSTAVDLEVLVVDNASLDNSVEMVRAEFPWARMLVQPSNLGFAAANNLALKALGIGAESTPELAAPDYTARRRTFRLGSSLQAVPANLLRFASERLRRASTPVVRKSEMRPGYVLLLNPDSEVRTDAIATLVNFLHAHPRAGAVGAQLIYPDGRFQHSAFRFPGLAQTFFDFFPLHHRLLNSRLNGRYRRSAWPFEIDHPLGACMLVRRAVVEQVGLMDEGFFMYVEEVDWCRRMRMARWQIWCEPRAMVVHHEAQATRQFRQAMFVALWRSRLRYFRKYYSPLYVSLVRAIIRLGLWHEARNLSHRPNLSSDERARRLAAFAEVRAMS